MSKLYLSFSLCMIHTRRLSWVGDVEVSYCRLCMGKLFRLLLKLWIMEVTWSLSELWISWWIDFKEQSCFDCEFLWSIDMKWESFQFCDCSVMKKVKQWWLWYCVRYSYWNGPLGMGGGIWVPTNLYFLCRMNKEYILFFYSHLYLFKVYFILMYRSDLKIIETLLWNIMLRYFIINYLIKELSYS